MFEAYDLSADPEPIDELQRELERIARAVSQHVDARGRARDVGAERAVAERDADAQRLVGGRSGPSKDGDRPDAERSLQHQAGRSLEHQAGQSLEHQAGRSPAPADHAERLADRLATLQLDAELVESRLLADCSYALPATAIGRHRTRLTGRVRRGTSRQAARRRAVDRHAG